MHEAENRQRVDAVFTFTDLDPKELRMVNAIALWQDKNQWTDLLYEPHGRSLVFQSPTQKEEDNYNGIFAGIQIIGVGGTPSAIRNGFRYGDEEIRLHRVSDRDCSQALAPIFQKRNITKEGALEMFQRLYAPTAGMDQPEAESRRDMTEILDEYSKEQRHIAPHFPFITPSLAAEGIYTEKKDPQGRPLHFQAYRTPVLPRFPTQLTNEVFEHGAEAGIQKLSAFSFLLGDTLRVLHDSGLAYMDGHMGNMSLLEKADEFPRIYITDLGSIKDFSEHPYGDRYRGLDIYAHLLTLEEFFPYFEHVAKNSRPQLSEEELADYYWTSGGRSLFEGYFYRSLVKAGAANNPDVYEVKINEYFKEIVDNYATNASNPQNFVTSFEEFYKRVSQT